MPVCTGHGLFSLSFRLSHGCRARPAPPAVSACHHDTGPVPLNTRDWFPSAEAFPVGDLKLSVARCKRHGHQTKLASTPHRGSDDPTTPFPNLQQPPLASHPPSRVRHRTAEHAPWRQQVANFVERYVGQEYKTSLWSSSGQRLVNLTPMTATVAAAR